ncbi:MAG: ABC transporter permease [Ferruginibacter sp.]|nr:ABC transporter permease [Ferruginibacter sp.]
MIRNYLMTTYRSLAGSKINSFINITGLAFSIACCIFIYVFIKHEKTFDNFHSKADRIQRIVFDNRDGEKLEFRGATPFPVARALRNEFPQLETVTQVYIHNEALIVIEDEQGGRKIFEDNDMTYADEYFFSTFDFKKLAGNAQLLQQPDEVVLTRRLADKFFGTKDVAGYSSLIGKTITVDKASYRVSAILEDMPRNSNIACHMLLPFKVFEKKNPGMVQNWNDLWSESYTFVTLSKNYSAASFDKALVNFKNKYLDADKAKSHTYHPQPLLEVHGDERYGGTYYATPGVLILAFIIMGVIVLLTSCINFVNLAIVQSLKRAKEIGIRKTLGSGKSSIMLRFMGETFVLISIASVIAIFLAHYFLNAFNEYLSFIVELDLHIDGTIILFLLALAVLITLAGGYYPARLMASIHPIQALKHSIKAKHTGFTSRFSLRKFLVITQFTVSQLLIIGTVVVATQMKFFKNRDLGYERDSILTIQLPENDRQKLNVFRNKLMNLPQVKDVSFNSGPPTSASNGFTFMRKKEAAKSANFDAERKFVDDHYLSTFHIKLLAGRDLRESDKVTLGDSVRPYNILLNKKATAALGYKTADEAIGQEILVQEHEFATIVGVTDDFFNVSLQQQVSPCLLFYGTNWVGTANINMSNVESKATLTRIEKEWQQLYPDDIYKASTLNYYMEHKAFYVIEDIMYQGFKVFVVLSLLIGCMGLYGLVAFLALQRQKEIGIRKVLGSSVNGIVYLFSKEFTWMVIISFLIAAPLGYFAMKTWLQTFANRIDLHAGFFVVSLLLSLLIAGLTVGFQAVKAAIANPVKSLRSE